MTTNLQNFPQDTQTTPSFARQRQTRLRADADAILRDMAFVLKMTQRVKAEMFEENSQSEPLAV